MKIKIYEGGERFDFEFEPESIADAALLARLALNATKVVHLVSTTARKDGAFTGWLAIGKRKQPDGEIRR